MKRKILTLLAVVFTVATLMCVTALAVSADAEPSATIAKFNLAFEDNTYLKYAVRFDGVADEKITENNIGMLYWTDYEGGFVPGTEDYSSKTTGYTDINGVKHYVFEYTHIAAKQLTDYIYSVAYIELDGETYYSEPVKYSALEYAYNRLGKTSEGTTNEELRILLEDMLRYGASAQRYFNYKEERLANDNYYQITIVGGTLDDGFTSGLYYTRDEIKITAPETNGDLVFCTWTNTFDDSVSTENPLIVTNLSANTTYTANYKENIKYSEGLELRFDGDYYTVLGIGTCTDTDIIIPREYEGYPITAIDSNAFFSETSIKSFAISELVTNIGHDAFSNCSRLENITVHEANPSFKTIDGNLYSKDGTVLFNYAPAKTADSFTIPDGVTTIFDRAFATNKTLKTVVFSNSVSSIYTAAFAGCTGLRYIDLPSELFSIGEAAFMSCSSLTSVTIPEKVSYIHRRAFYNCTALTEINFNATYLNDCVDNPQIFADAGTSSVGIAVTIGENVTKIPQSLFWGGKNIVSVNFTSDKVSWIAENAFLDCSNLETVILTKSVNAISEAAFAYCDKLSAVYYKGSESDWANIRIQTRNEKLQNALRYYYSETAPTIEGNFWHYVDGVPEIWPEYVAPSYSEGLVFTSNDDGTCYVSGIGTCTDKDVIIPPNSPEGWKVTSIGKMAFRGCSSLSVVIPDSVTSIGDYAFAYCRSLTSIEIPDSVTDIGYYAFYECSSLTSVVIGVSVTSIGYYAFEYCISLTSVVIGDSVTSIGDFAFYDCLSLTSIEIPDSVTSIGYCAFSRCTSLTSIEVDANNAVYKSIDGNLYTKDGKNLVQYALGKSNTSFVIPDSVTSIGYAAFEYCISLTSAVIGDSVTSIGSYAFEYCISLTSVVIGDSVTSIGDFAFYDCLSLTSIEIPDSVTSIGYCAFSRCTSLTSIEVDANNAVYKSIDGNLYTKDGKNLVQYAVGKSNTSFVIPDSVTSIGAFAFYDCSSLTSVVTGDNVTSIGTYAFYNCTSLKDVYYTGSEADWAKITIGSYNDYFKNATIHFNYVK